MFGIPFSSHTYNPQLGDPNPLEISKSTIILDYMRKTEGRSEFVARGIKFIIEPIVWIAQSIFFSIYDCFSSRNSPYYTEQLTINHLELYIKKYNKESSNHSMFLCPRFSHYKLENQSQDSAIRLFNEQIEEFEKDFLNSENCKKPASGNLRNAMLRRNKPVLVMLMNVSTEGNFILKKIASLFGETFSGKHWTTIQFNFAERTVSYLDSKGDVKIPQVIEERLEQALAWIQSMDNEPWERDKPKIQQCQQFDYWNCGVFAIELADIVGQYSNDRREFNLKFADMQRRITARRLDMMTIDQSKFLE